MKKKHGDNKKQSMPEFAFKEFTAEEDRIYEEAVKKYREAIAAGKTLRQAYESFSISDESLRSLIQADFLKILIAERHFSGRQSLEQIARELNIPAELVRDTHARMLQEVGISAAKTFSKEHEGFVPKTND